MLKNIFFKWTTKIFVNKENVLRKTHVFGKGSY